MRLCRPEHARHYHRPLALLATGAGLAYGGVVISDRWLLHHPGYPGAAAQLLLGAASIILPCLLFYVFLRKEAQCPLMFEKTFLQSFDDSDAGVCTTDRQGRITDCNEAFARFVGYSPEELRGLAFPDLIDPEERSDVASLWRNAAGGGQRRWSLTQKYWRKNGEVAWGRVAVSFVRDGLNGLGAILLVQDISREQEGFKALEASEQELRRLLDEAQRNEQQVSMLARAVESATDSIVITELDGSIVYVNPYFESLTGYTRAEVYGKNPRVLSSGQQPPEFYKQLWQTLASGGVWKGRFVNRRKDGSLYTEEATIAPVHDAKGFVHKYVAVKRDVTKLEELENELRHAQKMEAVGQLAGGVAHDLNNVLQIITLASHLALTNKDGDFKDARVKEMAAAASRGAGVISQLLAFSRRQTMRLQDLSLNDVVTETAKLLKHLLRADIELRLDLDARLDNIKADPVQITQVILNLAVNARDAMPNGGVLEIATRNFKPGDDFLHTHSPMLAASYARLTVRDTGTGIDEATKARIFEPFFTTKEIGKGTGLGLSTVYGIVTQSKGHIEFDSVLSQGTTFSLYFPACEKAASLAAPDAGTTGVAATRSACYSVLVVEDDEMVRSSLAAALEKEDFRVFTAASAEAALESAARNCPVLVIADVMMPGMKGTELVELLKQQNPSIQTILTSGYCDEEIVQRASQTHGSLFIQKPFTIAELVEASLRLCHGSSNDKTFAAGK